MTQARRETYGGIQRAVCENDRVCCSARIEAGGCRLEVGRTDSGAKIALEVLSPSSEGGSALATAREEDTAAEAIVGGIVPTTASSWDVRARVSESSGAIEAECRVMNRSLLPLASEPRLAFRMPAGAQRISGGVVVQDASAGLAIHLDERAVSLSCDGEFVEARPRTHSKQAVLLPHRTRVYRFDLIPLPPDIGAVVAVSNRAALSLDEAEGRLWVVVSEDVPSGKAFLRLTSGETLEAPLHAYANKPAAFTIRGLGGLPERARLLDDQGKTILDAALPWREEEEREGEAEAINWEPTRSGIWAALADLAAGEWLRAERTLFRLTNDAGCESAAWFLLGALAMRKQEWEVAAAYIDESLLYGGANPIAWIFRAWCVRKLGGDPTQELSNAHLLAPVDPLLRFDAFLEGGGEGLLDEFGSDAEPYLDAADLLWLAGREAERNVVLAAASERAPDPLVHRLRSAALREAGQTLEAEIELQKARTASGKGEGVRASEEFLIYS